MSEHSVEQIFGIHALQSAIENHPQNIIEIITVHDPKNPRLEDLIQQARDLGLRVRHHSMSFINRKCKDKHQGVIAEVKTIKLPDESQLAEALEALETPFVLILDQIEDPRNLGACLRSADAAGVDIVIFTKHKSSPLTSVARKTAAGAAETLKLFQVTNTVNTIKILKDNGVWVAGTDCDDNSTSLYETDLKGAICIVMSNEGKGIRPLVKKHCDYLIHIPMIGSVQSLNVSVATGITLFEVLRQRAPSESE